MGIIVALFKNYKLLIRSILVIAYAIIYVFILGCDLRADPTNKDGVSWLISLLTYSIIPSLLALALVILREYGNKIKGLVIIRNIFKNKAFIYIPIVIIIAAPLMDLANYYFNWGYLVAGTWSSFGLMVLCYLLILDSLELNYKTVIIAILGSFLFLSGWEAQYLTRYMVNFYTDPLSLSNAICTAVHVLITLPFAVMVYIMYKPRLTKMGWVLLIITLILMFIVASTKQFSIDWDGEKWINVEPDRWIYCINRLTKVTFALVIVNLKFNKKELVE